MTESNDLVSSTTHLFTAAWAAYATLILIRITRGHGPGRWAVGFFGLSMVLLYLASGTFHGARLYTQETDRFFQRLDKSAIFLLIAGSYVPVFVYLLRGHWRRWALGAMLGTAVAGIATLWLLPDLPHPHLVGVYVAMGVIGFVTIPKIVAVAGWSGIGWIFAVATTYLGGAIIEVVKWPVLVPGWVGPHEILHVADVLGTAAMFIFVTRYVIRQPPLTASLSRRQLSACT